MDDNPAIFAATLIVMREQAAGPPELLMVERPAAMAFAGGAVVFPGGRIDGADGLGSMPLQEAAKRAAVRETEEETGISLSQAVLTPFARWRPDFVKHRRFDTFFFLASAPGDAPEPLPQPGECERAFWITAAAMLDDIAAGRAKAIFPTVRNLERLALFGSFAEAKAQAESIAVETISPWIEEHAGERWLTIPRDLGYPVTRERLETALRA